MGFSQSDCCNYTLVVQDSTSTSNPYIPGSVRLHVYNSYNNNNINDIDTILTAGIPGTNGGLSTLTFSFTVCTWDSVQLFDNGHMLNGLETVDYWALYNPNGQMISNIHTNSGWSWGPMGWSTNWGYHYMPDSGHCNNNIQCIAPYNLNAQPLNNYLSAQLSWNAGGSAMFGYEVRYGETSLMTNLGSNPNPSNLSGFQTFFNTTATINGLNPNTDYTFFVRSLCDTIQGSTYITSNWVNLSYANGSIAPYTYTCRTPVIRYIRDINANGTAVKLVFIDTTSTIGPYVARNWEITYHESGAPFTTANIITKTTHGWGGVQIINNLNPATNYEFYVRKVCDSSMLNYSNWATQQHHTIDTCNACTNYYIELYDNGGDGWNGNSLSVYTQSYLSTSGSNNYTLQNGIYQMHSVQVCPGDSVYVMYNATGTNNHEVSFEVMDHNFNTVYNSGLDPANSEFWNPSYDTYIGYLPCQPVIQPMVLGGLVDMTLPNGNEIKGIELWANQDITDISHYGIEISQNGNGSSGIINTLPASSVSSGEKILISPDVQAYSDYFGNCFENYDEIINIPSSSGFDFDGNDAVSLYFNNEIIERFGHPHINGNGTAWDYSNSWAYKDSSLGSFNFSGGSWLFGDANCGNSTNYLYDSPCPYPICANYLSTAKTIESATLNVFPNPATDQLTMVSNEIIDEITLLDMVGKTVMREYPNDYRATLRVDHLPKNIYLLKCKINNTYQTKKIIVSD